jgi:thioredoxin 1
MQTNFDVYGLAFALTALREPSGQALGKPLRRQLKTRLDHSGGNRQRVVELHGIREIAHTELIQPLERAGAAFAADHDVYQKFLRVHDIRLPLLPARCAERLTVKIKVQEPSLRLPTGIAMFCGWMAFAFAVWPSSAQAPHPAVLQLDVWRMAVLAGDAQALTPLYANNARIVGPNKSTSNVSSEVAYWSGWKAKGLKTISAEIEGAQEPQPGFHVLSLQLTLLASQSGAQRKYYVKMAQGYAEQNGVWKIAAEQREEPTRLKGPTERKDLYPADADARKEIEEALHAAAKSHKRVMLIFGGNWCYDCHVLDAAFRAPEIAPTLNRNYVVVHVDVGEYNKNLDLAKKYEVPLERGVPAAAVLDSDGKLLVSQKNQEFEKARSMAPEDILAFLNKWKPTSVQR